MENELCELNCSKLSDEIPNIIHNKSENKRMISKSIRVYEIEIKLMKLIEIETKLM